MITKIVQRKISKWIILPALLLSLTLSLFNEHSASADAYSWLTGTLSGQQRDDLSTNPDDYGMYGQCTFQIVELAGSSPTSVCLFQAKSFRYAIVSGQLFIRKVNDTKMYPINNMGFASYTNVVPSPNTDDFIFSSTVVKDLPSKVTFNNQYAGSYDPDQSFSTQINLDEQSSAYTVSSRSVSMNGEWMVVNVQYVGFVRIHLADFSVTRLTSYDNLNKFTAVSNDGRFVAVTSFNNSDPLIYDLTGCGQNATTLQSGWSGVANSNPCSSRNLSSAINDTFNGSGYTTSSKPEFSDDGWQLTLFAGNGVVAKGVTLSASSYTAPSTTVDSDGDGLTDYAESYAYPNRQAVFCGVACAYPNPATKDLYVELDWMKQPNILGDRILKPTAAQLSLVEDAYDAQGINAHFDAGQFGGGNELPYFTQQLSFQVDPNNADFYEYKDGTSTSAVNFNTNRYHIWHYMISGYEFTDIPGSSGASWVSDDDSFISTGRIIDNPENSYGYTNIDHAIAGTILHELGHALCLTNPAHAPESMREECIYSGIDDEDGLANYPSVMNYSYQMSDLIDYSDNLNSLSQDHDDWGAVDEGFADFATSNNEGDLSSGAGKLRVGITSSQAKKLRKTHKLFTHVDETKRSLKRQQFDIKERLFDLRNLLSELRH